jgi:protein-S-isoprenylcysteine O-methyltransferase Ste14
MRFVIVQTFLLAGLAVAFVADAGPLTFAPGALTSIVGKMLVVSGVSLALAAGISLGSATKLSPTPGSTALVQRGVYRFLRHPMYTSAILASIGLFLARPLLSVGLAVLAVIFFYLFKTGYEERLLLAHYPGYAEYRSRTLGTLLTKPRRKPGSDAFSR